MRWLIIVGCLAAAGCSEPECREPGRTRDCDLGLPVTRGVEICTPDQVYTECLAGSGCNPLTQTGCPDDEACFHVSTNKTVCLSPSEHPCPPGTKAFFDNDGHAVCDAYCDFATYPDISDPEHCRGGYTCWHFEGMPEGVGACVTAGD